MQLRHKQPTMQGLKAITRILWDSWLVLWLRTLSCEGANTSHVGKSPWNKALPRYLGRDRFCVLAQNVLLNATGSGGFHQGSVHIWNVPKNKSNPISFQAKNLLLGSAEDSEVVLKHWRGCKHSRLVQVLVPRSQKWTQSTSQADF